MRWERAGPANGRADVASHLLLSPPPRSRPPPSGGLHLARGEEGGHAVAGAEDLGGAMPVEGRRRRAGGKERSTLGDFFTCVRGVLLVGEMACETEGVRRHGKTV